MDRHTRQTRLAEVGPLGQARLAGSRVAVGLTGLAAHVAVRYLAGAGAGCLSVRDAALADVARAVDPAVEVLLDPELPAHDGEAFDLRDPAAREVAAGAVAALRALRAALALGGLDGLSA